MFLNRVVVYFFLRFRQLRESFKICHVRRCCAIIVFTGVQIPLALIRRGFNSKKMLPTWTGVFLIRIKSGVSRLKFRAQVSYKQTTQFRQVEDYSGQIRKRRYLGPSGGGLLRSFRRRTSQINYEEDCSDQLWGLLMSVISSNTQASPSSISR